VATPTQKALVSSKSDATGAGIAWPFVLPGTSDGASAGQCALLVLAQAGSTSTTDLSGWTALTGTPTTGTASAGRFYVWSKTLVSGDLGLTVNFTPVSTSRYAAACLVVDPATVDISGITETQTSGTVMTSPSVDPTATDGLLVTIFGPIVNTSAATVTWTATSPITEIVDICSNSGIARNATMLVATEALTTGAVTGTRTGTPTGNVQRQTIALVLAAAGTAVNGASRLALSGSSASVKLAVQQGSSTLGLAGSGVSRKVSPQSSTAKASFSGTSTPHRVATQVGTTALGIAALGLARRTAAESGTAAWGFSSTGTSGKTTASTGAIELSLSGSGVAKKTTGVAGRLALALVTRYVSSQHPVRGSCHFSIGSASTPRKVVTFLATDQGFYPGPDTYPGPSLFPGWPSEAVLFDYLTTATTSSLAVSRALTGSASLGLRGGVIVGHGVGGRSSLLLSATSIRKIVAAAGTAFLGLASVTTTTKVIAQTGRCGLSLTLISTDKKTAVAVGLSSVSLTGTGFGHKAVSSSGVSVVSVSLQGLLSSRRIIGNSRCVIALAGTGRVGRYALAGVITAADAAQADLAAERALIGRAFGAVNLTGGLTVHVRISWGLMSGVERQPIQMIGI
jgi:hypothetical protein